MEQREGVRERIEVGGASSREGEGVDTNESRVFYEDYPQDQSFSLQWFRPLLRQHRSVLLHIVASSLLLQVCILVPPLFLQVVIDKVLVYYSLPTLVVATGGLGIVGVFKGTLDFLRTRAIASLASNIDMALGSFALQRVLALPVRYFETTQTGQIVDRFRELDTLRRFLTGAAIGSVFDFILSVLVLAVLVFYSLKLTLLALLFAGLHILVSRGFLTKSRAIIRQRTSLYAANQQFLVETIVGITTLKAAAAERIRKTQWDCKLAEYLNVTYREEVFSAIWRNIHDYLSILSTAAQLFCGATLIAAGRLKVGELLAFNMIAALIGSPLARLTFVSRELQQARVSIARLAEFTDAPPERPAVRYCRTKAVRGCFQLLDVGFRYSESQIDVFDGLSLEIPAGQVIGVIGPTGSGKSTLAKLIQGFYAPQRGTILIDGMDIATLPPAWLRHQIGVVLQEPMLFNATIHENIALADPEVSRDDVVRAAGLAGADEFIARLTSGYDSLVEERGANLSGGQRQRIAIARALLRNPRVLIFDEATGALDHESERMVQNKLAEIRQARTVIIIAHHVAAIRTCDRIVTVKGGRITEDGTHEEMRRLPGSFYRRLISLQD